MPKKTLDLPDQSQEFKNLLDLLALFSEATDRLHALQLQLNEDARSLVDEHREEIADLQGKIGQAERAIETLCNTHRDWFRGKQSLTTAYGKCAFRTAKSLVVPNEPASVAIIMAEGDEAVGTYLRTRVELDLENLEKLPDAELARFGITRAAVEKFAIVPGKVDLGKAVADEAKEAA